MAEAVVSVLSKLAVVIVNEAQFLGGVEKKVERVQRELIRIKSCLIDAHSKRKGDERVQNWLNELRNLAYRIEDAIDTFFLKVEGHRREDASIFQNLIKKVCNKSKQLYFRHKLGNELDDIKNLLKEISKSRVTYGIRDDLPQEDKSKGEACFQYLASFPEDYVISAKRLIRMWVAEGFIPLEGTTTMEILAEECLEELAERNIIQVLSRYSVSGLIKCFKVHDILRELAMHEAMNENFVTVFSHASNDTKPNRIIRRASLQAKEKNSQFIKYVGQNTRSLLLFEAEYCKTGLHWSNFRLLKVLEITRCSGQLVLKSLDELIHLKYLGIRDCKIDLSSCSLHRMRSLETLDVRGSSGKQPCDDFWSIGTLRHVQGETQFFRRPLPKCIDLNHLQTMKWVTVEGAFDWKLPQLCKLGIINESNEWISITNLLQTLPLLVSLQIFAVDSSGLPMEIVYPKALPNYQNLQSLELAGKWPENVNVEARLFPPHLVKLVLYQSDLKQNPMPELGKLNSLKKLCLGYKAFSWGWKDPIICSEEFPSLQYLEVIDPFSNIKDLTVAQGVMPKLTYLKVDSKKEVHLPPELQHVRVEKD